MHIAFYTQHAMRDHMLRCMRIKHNEELPDSHDEGDELYEDDPVRFVWEKTVKKCPHNATMKEHVLKDLIARRKRYKYVPEKDFDREILDSAFEQAFSTFRQKYKMQKNEMSALQHKQREEQKYMKARRKERKKAVCLVLVLCITLRAVMLTWWFTEIVEADTSTAKARSVLTSDL